MRKVEIEDHCKEKARRVEELTETADAVQAKRGQLQKQAAFLQDNIAKFAKVGQKARVTIKGTDLLRKEEAYSEMVAGFEALTAGKY